ncbi:type VI secretion system membrane subunit TssM [Chitinilyticum litopenaei]|uniref:type VI secretion system membrane subunit TssM n=1 Tax=Chitinilyticum litopenaei TaxID=1121276 RepID=UPI000416B4DC|nr:type VI secretion system membrane subunit TssM [Chitinilyticum litopenaei]
MSRLFRIFSSSWFWSALGLLCLSIVIWWVGPLVSIAQWRPLAPAWVRIVVLTAIWVIYWGALAYTLFRERKAQKELEQGMQRDETAGTSEAAQALGQRFNEALEVLRQVRPEEEQGGLSRFFARMDRQSHLYRLPWFMVLGAPGSGKTTVLQNSGLKFPLGNDAVDGVGGTRNCKWLFADQAVLLDLAGRYTTHESDRLQDSAEWGHFLKLLKRTRARQPINGVLVTIAADSLLKGQRSDLENQANSVRQRIQELQQVLSLEVPVYLLVTKCDLIAGFAEFFESLTSEERQQVWGFTLPLPAGEKEHVAISSFAGQVDGLLEGLQAMLVGKLQKESEVLRRSAVGVFPQSLHTVRQSLIDFAEAAFSQNPYQPRVLFRGVYLTSAAQQGEIIDPLFGAVPQELGLKQSFSRLLGPQMVFRPYFLTRLFSELVLGESHLAGRNINWHRKRTLARTLGYVSLAAVSLIALTGLVLSYQHNSDYVQAVNKKLPATQTKVEQVNITADMNIADVLPALDSVMRIADPGANSGGVNVPGLGQQEKLQSASNDAYKRMLEDTLLAYVNFRLEEGLRSYRNDPDLLYETLKAYLMLHDPKHFDEASLRAWVLMDWESHLANSVTAEQRKQLEMHFNNLLVRGLVQSKAPLQKDLVNEVRALISTASLPQRVYGRIKRMGVADGIAPFRLTEVAGPSAAVVFVRSSGAPLSQGIEGFYTADGYAKAFLPALDPTLKELQSEEGWVLDAPAVMTTTSQKVLGGDEAFKRNKDLVKRLYLEEYAGVWERFVNDVRIVPGSNLQQSVHLARLLSAPDSPLLYFLRGVTRETSLVALSDADVSAAEALAKAAASSAVQAQKDKLQRLVNAPVQQRPATIAMSKPEYIVENRFLSIHRLVNSPTPGAPAPIDSTLVLLSDLYNHLSATEIAVQSKGALPQSDVPVRLKSEAQRMPAPLNAMLQTLSDVSMRNAQGEARSNLSSLMQNTVGETCTQSIDKRYPFNRASTQEVKRDDFQKFFAPGGVIDSFFQKNLAQDVDMTGKTWALKPLPGSDTRPATSSALAEFQRASAIRSVFFASGASPQVRFTIKPVEMGTGVIQSVLDIDGQLLRYRHDAIVPAQMTWPGKGTGQVRLSLTSTKGEDIGSLSYEGDWALWRAIDRAVQERTDRPETIRVTFKIQGHYVKYDITASTAQNPFVLAEMDKFSCPMSI